MNRPDAMQTSSGGGHMETHRNDDGTWTVTTNMVGVEPVTAAKEMEAAHEMTRRMYEALQRGISGPTAG